MSAYYVLGEEPTIHGTDGEKTFTPYECNPVFHSTPEEAQYELRDYFPDGNIPKYVSIWKIERVKP